jgi:hypothetical protein
MPDLLDLKDHRVTLDILLMLEIQDLKDHEVMRDFQELQD